MAKKLIYTYTFTPGVANEGKIEVTGNYPSKLWQIVTDTGTGGLYPHTFIRDEYASTTGAIQIITGGSGDLTLAVSGTTFNATSGVLTVSTTASHGLSTGATIKFRERGLTFTCAKDNYETEHSYPRTTDPIYDTAISITVVDNDTFTVYVGRPSGGAISSQNEIIYNFADATKGGSTYYNKLLNKTTLTLQHDTSHLDPLDDLQIFVDEQEEKVDFSETFVDPVSKLRVSNPQNLIDTDFEYGLQPTKWETMELVNNIPSFFASSNDYSISDVISVTTVANTENVSVLTRFPHGLSVGAPIDVQGLTSRTAEGKFLVTTVISDTQFTYKAKNVLSTSETINTSYTVITPGEFYSGSKISISDEYGIETDAATPSTLKLYTDYHHGFAGGSSLYYINTIGKKQLQLTAQTTSTAPDGRPYVDSADTLSTSLSVDSTLTETKQMTGTYAHKFSSSAVNISNDTITWPSHSLQQGDVLLYVPPSGDIQIGGLDRFQIYYVKSTPTTDTITLCETTNGNYSSNPTINLTSTGTSDYGRHQLILGYEIAQSYKQVNASDTQFRTRAYVDGSGSGRDMSTYTVADGNGGYFGLGGKKPERYMLARRSGSFNYNLVNSSYCWYYSPSFYYPFTFGKSGTTPDGWDFIEDFQRWNQPNYSGAIYGTGLNFSTHFYNYRSISIYYVNGFQRNNSATVNEPLGEVFFFPLQNDSEADTFFIQNHGLENGSAATLLVNSGNDVIYRNDAPYVYTNAVTGTYGNNTSFTVSTKGPDRITLGPVRLQSASGSYNIDGTVTNETANTFYIDSHDLITDTQITIGTGAGGVIPSSTSGASIPNNTTSLDSVYAAVVRGMNTVKNTIDTDSGGESLLLLDGSQSYYPFGSSNRTFNNGRQYFYSYYSFNYVYIYNSSLQTIQQVRSQYHFEGSYSNKVATGVSWDQFEGTALEGFGFRHIRTPYTFNSTIPYYILGNQIPSLGPLGGTYAALSPSRFAYNYSGLTREHTNLDNSVANYTSLGNGWGYTYDAAYFQPNSTYHGFIHMTMWITNSNWPSYSSSYSPSIFQNTSFYPYFNFTGAGGQGFMFEVMIPINAGTTVSKYGNSGSVLTNSAIANAIANEISSVLTEPNLSVDYLNPVIVESVNANRFRLKSPTSNLPYNLTNSGSATLTFETGEETGALDGFYSIDVSNNTDMSSFVNSQIPARKLSVPYSDVVTINNTNYFNYPNHKLKNTQRLYYDAGDDTPSELTIGTPYYALVSGPDHFRISATADEAEQNIEKEFTVPTAGISTFTINSISGISSAPGKVGLTSSTNVVTGTDTLFKRFFRTGDTLKISDASVSPPRYTDYIVSSVIDDTELTIVNNPPDDIASTNHYVETKVNVRPDGAFLHRPFDGGVEINAGTSPNSSIVRQTRKYFRYQSGKGIQCSVAINFNPSRIATTLVGTLNGTLPSLTFNINVNNNETISYSIAGNHRDGKVFGGNSAITLVKGDILNLLVTSQGHPLWIKTATGTGTGNAVTTGVTNNGTDNGTISWDTSSITAGTYYYQCQNHSSMFGEIIVEDPLPAGPLATITTEYPHGLTRNNSVNITGASESVYNGIKSVVASTDFTFTYQLAQTPTTTIPNGIIEYNIDSWSNSAVRCGLFDYQNGMFYEFDGSTLYAVRRSSVQQLSGTVSASFDSNTITGRNTSFSRQLNSGDYIVIRGGSYRITNVASDTSLDIQPAYRGVQSSGISITKTVDTRVAQSDWSIDKADGTGPSGFALDITKIQMAYIDYSWYGAGKIRFGFKDANGHVKYMHEFLHNNVNTEAYMRSGNIPGRYEIENFTNVLPTYVPSLFHWGTSVIMDGRFDDDKAYLFTASSNSLSFTNGDSNDATTTANEYISQVWNSSTRQYDFYLSLTFSNTDANKFSTGTKLYTADEELNGEEVAYSFYSGSSFIVRIYLQSSRSYFGAPAVYPNVPSGTVVSIGAPPSGGAAVDLLQEVPLISIRLAPSVDNNLTGAMGQREIINRMQLQLKSVGITLSHDCNVDLILNGGISNRNFENVQTPSLSELIKHEAGDRVIGGTKIFSLRASGGTENAAGRRLSSTSDFDISQITDLGNAILGGDGTFPNGPDVLTIALVPVDTAEINATTPLAVSARITWTESQA